MTLNATQDERQPTVTPLEEAIDHVRGSLDSCVAFVQEFWAGADRNLLCWCPGCGLMYTVGISDRPLSHEPRH